MIGLVERQREHFNSIAEKYFSARLNANHLVLKKLIWSEFLHDKSPLNKANLNVLDAMCGYADANGILREHLHAKIDYSGFDYSEEVIERVRRENPDLRVWQADATEFCPDRNYDLVVLLGGLHHVHHAASRTLKRLAAAIKPGGHFLSLEPTHGNRIFGAVRNAIYRRNDLFDAATERDFSVRELSSMFEEAGLQPIDAMYPGLLSYVLYYNPDAFP
ncbi:MAG: methyltransferase domain-containing protein [Xanthobacteraceae bacterium]